jgi:FkbM family methyltransferase
MGMAGMGHLKKAIKVALGLRPNLKVEKHAYNLVHLGTPYGGWTFVDDGYLRNSVIISAGLGEDASFDVEFATRFDAKVIVVDPTPRAIVHFRKIAARLGEHAAAPYSNDGNQPVEAYDLGALNAGSLQLVPRALWNEEKKLRFYSPPNPKHVSHSVINYQNDYRNDTQFIEVDSMTVAGLLKYLSITDFCLIKLDIEGAEVEVLLDMMKDRIFPKQVLVEYDELNVRSGKSKGRVESAHRALLGNGYHLVHHATPNNFLYVREAFSTNT